MKAVVWHGIGDIRLDNVPEPEIKEPTDALVKLTASAICGTDLHFVRGTFPGMVPGTILGHEGVGLVEEVGRDVRNLKKGDRVVIPSTVGCGICSYCRAGYFSQCDNANPAGKQGGTVFFGGPKEAGGLPGLQAEFARIPYANVGPVKLPGQVTDDQAILLSDIFPTGFFGADLAEIKDGNIVAVFGCGPVGQFAILSAQLLGAGRVFAIDSQPDRLAMAQGLGAEVINFNEEDPMEALLRFTGGTGVDRAIDAVGIDAQAPHQGPAALDPQQTEKMKQEVQETAPEQHPANGNWVPGNAPSQALRWATQAVCKAGTVAIIGVYPPKAEHFPIGIAMNKNLTINMGNCNHRRYLPELVRMVKEGKVDPEKILTQREPVMAAIDAYKQFDQRKAGWIKVELKPLGSANPIRAEVIRDNVHA